MSTTPLTGPSLELVAAVRRKWWLVALMGVLAVVAGIVVLVEPDRSLTLVTIVFGVYLVLLAPIRLALALMVPGLSGTLRAVEVLIAVFSLIAGIIVIANPGAGLLAIALAFGIYLLVAGTIRLFLGVAVPDSRVWNIAVGVLDLVGGTLVIAYPDIGLDALAVILSIYLLLRGVFDLALAWLLYRLRQALAEPPQRPAATGAPRTSPGR
jgi:uncharacterized membrane protein HdeD (DUF308 family)